MRECPHYYQNFLACILSIVSVTIKKDCMQDKIDKVKNILEALPYITQFSGKIVVIKYGGAAMVTEALKEPFATDVVLLKYLGIHPVIVHGGGPFINTALKNMQVSSHFVKGHRVTDHKTMEVVEMVLSGKINKEIVTLINSKGGRAIGFSCRDAKFALGEKYLPMVANENGIEEPTDIGLVGQIKNIDPKIIYTLLKDGFIPVISPISETNSGEPLNVNADNAAGAIAGALNAEKLVLLTDTGGILIKEKPVSVLSRSKIQEYKTSGDISGGMIPKVDCCLEALDAGVNKAHIIDGRIEHSVLLELFTDSGVGTLIEND
jgi:acetylglutamate kinase